MDHLRERLDALEQQVHTLTQHTQMATRRLRWWRGLACGLAMLGLLGWGLPLSLAREDGSEKHTDQKDLAQRVAALEKLLKHFSRKGNEITIKGANLHIVNGRGTTETTNALRNLIVGYNEPREEEKNIRTGSHNVVVGKEHNFSRFGGVVVGQHNTISGDFASVSGGLLNVARGTWSAVSGGSENSADNIGTSISGGNSNSASGISASVSGGSSNVASGGWASVSGGQFRGAGEDFGWAAGSSGDEISGSFRSP